MASRTRTTPVAVVKVVSITSVPGTYRRSTAYSPAGRIDQWPPSGSRMRAKVASESYRGKQSQSIDPSRLTRAAELQSASNPCSPIGVKAPRCAAGAAAGWVAAELMALQSADRRERYGDCTRLRQRPRDARRSAMDRDADHLARRRAVDLD